MPAKTGDNQHWVTFRESEFYNWWHFYYKTLLRVMQCKAKEKNKHSTRSPKSFFEAKKTRMRASEFRLYRRTTNNLQFCLKRKAVWGVCWSVCGVCVRYMGWDCIARSALLSGYLGKSRHLPRYTVFENNFEMVAFEFSRQPNITFKHVQIILFSRKK